MTPTLAPFGWTVFAQTPPPDQKGFLEAINRMVNNSIDPMPMTEDYSGVTHWYLAPKLGWCHDYAITKRWLLLGLGFKESELRLCECVTPDGTNHMVLLVGDVALDNLTSVVGPMRYQIRKLQSSINPDLWEEP